MYEQIEKPKENNSKAIAKAVAQKKSNKKQGHGYVGYRPDVVAQRKLHEMINNHVMLQGKGSVEPTRQLQSVNINDNSKNK